VVSKIDWKLVREIPNHNDPLAFFRVGASEILPGQGGGLQSLSQAESAFLMHQFDTVLNSIKQALYYQVVLATDFAANPAYTGLRNSADPSVDFVPQPYRLINIENADTAKALCQALNVDAVGVLGFGFTRHRYRDNFQFPFSADREKVTAMARVVIVNKSGTVIFDQMFSEKSTESVEYEANISRFNLNGKNSPLVQEATEKLNAKIATYLETIKPESHSKLPIMGF
jgi:hypothetical protein